MMKRSIVMIMVATTVCMVSQICQADNVAQGKLATADSQYNASYPPYQAVDGNPNSRWISDSASPHWFMVDLDGVHSVTSIQVAATSGAEDRLDGALLTVYEKSDGTGAPTYSNTITVSGGQPIATFNMPAGITAASIKISGAGDASGYMAFEELYAYGTPLVNEAQSKQSTADSFYSSLYPPGYVVDGDADTRWVSKNTDAPHWWRVDLDEMYDIDMVEVRVKHNVVDRLDGSDLTLYHSLDAVGDSTYSNVVSVTEDNVTPFASRQLTHNFIMPEGTMARSVKLSGTGNASYFMDCAEVRVYGTLRVNLAVGKAVSADSTYTYIYRPEMGADNDLGTRWYSTATDVPHWWMVDLGDQYDIEIVQVRMNPTITARLDGSLLTLYASPDGSGAALYSDTVSVSSAEPVHTFVLPDGVKARSVKISGTGDSSHIMGIYELRVYGREPLNGTLIILE